jgi:poly [ADP-ribose] polymerase 2/3/4
MGYDDKKMPFVKLSNSSISKAYTTLSQLLNELRTQGKAEIIAKLSLEFYACIPHDFGFKKMTLFILDSEVKLKEKLNLLRVLEYAQTAFKLDAEVS